MNQAIHLINLQKMEKNIIKLIVTLLNTVP